MTVFRPQTLPTDRPPSNWNALEILAQMNALVSRY